MGKIVSSNPFEQNIIPGGIGQRLRRWLIQPSSKITEPDRRRQASLLSGFLIGTMLLAGAIELLTIAFIDWQGYTGYWQTIVVVICLGIVYGISRTHRVQLAALLSVIVAAGGVYLTGWVEPRSAQGGLFDFMILPLWLGSLYLSPGGLATLVVGTLLAILLFPFLTPQVTLNEMLVGPFSFLFATSVLLLIITQYRNKLEQDRRIELVEQERRSRHEAARAEALLRVADRLNAQLDLDTLLAAICEEIIRAFDTTAALVALYDEKRNVLYPAAGQGIPGNLIKSLPPLSRSAYDHTVAGLGTVFQIPDLRATTSQSYLNHFKDLDIRSIAFATMAYDHALIGSLNVLSLEEHRDFTSDELLLLQGLAHQAALAITNTRLYKDARRRLEHLQALRAIDIAISSNHDLRETLNVLLEQITKQLGVNAAVILLLDEAKQQLEFGTSWGFQTSTLRYTSLRLGEGMAGRAAQQRQIVHVSDLRIDPQSLASASELTKEGFVSYHAAPLISQGRVKGVLEIFHRSPLDPDDEWLGFLEILAGQAAIAIESTSLFEDLQRTNEELSKAYDSTIEGWSRALDLRDKETEGHTLRVTELTLELARAMGFTEAELVHIRRGALLHDIGKMGVPDRILLKKGPLTPEEWEIMHMHPVYAHEMLKPVDYLLPAIDIPYGHHEKWDGTGYPRGLKGEKIPLAARIFAIVDVWDALISDRPYRDAWTYQKTLEFIRGEAGKHFDPRVVESFADLILKKHLT